MEKYIFTNLPDLGRLMLITVSTYVALVIMLRIAGKRTLAKMNAFDFVVTIAIGSVLSIIMMDKTIPLLEGIAALALLIILQYLISLATVNFKSLNSFVRSSPTLLFYEGEMLKKNMKKERVTKSEILASLRKEGIHSIADVKAVVIESNGDLSVIKKDKSKPTETLQNVNSKND
ncbi:MAG: DUF421 domain-containing protein [Bacteroidetes bacterium]|jgi:uncharacterized membrane protein YcaP (DUF421 family)|nr:DUF421 domain-containing protein [Bacteroidota bacterium]